MPNLKTLGNKTLQAGLADCYAGRKPDSSQLMSPTATPLVKNFSGRSPGFWCIDNTVNNFTTPSHVLKNTVANVVKNEKNVGFHQLPLRGQRWLCVVYFVWLFCVTSRGIPKEIPRHHDHHAPDFPFNPSFEQIRAPVKAGA